MLSTEPSQLLDGPALPNRVSRAFEPGNGQALLDRADEKDFADSAANYRLTGRSPSLTQASPSQLKQQRPRGEARSNADIAPCLSVLTPVYNEEATIVPLLHRVLEQRPVQELIVVDDCSRDRTWDALQSLAQAEPRLRILRHEKNQGKGAALRTALRQVSAPIAIIQDADMEYDPAEYFLILNPILAGKADVVFGSRFGGSSAHRVLYYWHSLGNKFLTTLSNMATNLNLTDMETCYKAFRSEVLEKITIEEDRFGFEPEITAKISKLKVRLYEVAISYYGRTYEEGKKVNWKDGLSALRCILKYNLLR